MFIAQPLREREGAMGASGLTLVSLATVSQETCLEADATSTNSHYNRAG